MKKKKEELQPREIVERLLVHLTELTGEAPTDKEQVRRTVQRLVEVDIRMKALSRYQLRNVSDAKAAKDRCLAYLQLFVGEAIPGAELRIVSGITEFRRRIGQLRVEHGYRIFTGYSRDDLKANEYLLESPEPNLSEAEKWRTANSIRKRSGSAEARILALLRTYVGQVLRGDELAYVAKIQSWRRRTGQLRTERGWRVVTRNTGRPDLKVGEYVLESDQQLPEHDREIPDEVYSAVLERDHHSCRRCGWNVDKRRAGDPKQFTEVHHIEHHGKGGKNVEANLITLCNVCHDSLHRDRITAADFLRWLGSGE